ncbi:MAG: Ig-like domain-containing protein, partial [Actinomycetota bacterium]|nr:Ig-like domain-containing protein [Actinomycetota bacterium]
MPVTSGERPSGTGGHAGPVLRWAQVGMAGAGLAAALLAGPATAAADTGAAAAGADSSAESDAPPRSPGRPAGEPRRGAGSDDEPANPAGSRTDTSEGSGAGTGSEPDAEPEVEAELEADLEVEADAVEDVETETDSSGSAGEASAPVIDDADSEPPAGAHGTAPLGEAETTEPDPTRSEPPPSPGAAATQPLTFGAPPATAATSRPQYPAPVDAPVTWRAIVADTLSWLGLGTLPSQPVPDVPVGDLLAGLWVGLRRAHYTFFNSAPVLTAGPATEDPETGLITGQLQAADADGDVVSYVLSGAPGAGTVSLTEDGAYTYTPGAGIAATGGTDTFAVAATDSGPANPWHTNLARRIQSALSAVGFAAPPAPGSTTTVTVTVTPAACRADSGGAACAAARAPKITVHNNSEHTIWVYNLPKSGDYSIGADFTPVSIAKGSSAPVTLAVGTGQPGSPENRIYIVEGESGFTLPVSSPSGVD